MNSLEISLIGAACGKNKFEPRNKIMLLQLCRQYKSVYRKKMFEIGAFQELDPNKKTYTQETKKIYSEFKSDISTSGDFAKVQASVTEKLKQENKDIKPEDIKHATDFIVNSMKKDCGNNNEMKVIDKMKYKKGNNRMYTYSQGTWLIKGLHDATCGDLVIEIKTRMKYYNVRKNEYDLYQLFGYLLSMKKTRGKIVQKFNGDIFDSDVETNNEFGLIDIEDSMWSSRFETFKTELNLFFEELTAYTDRLFDLNLVVDPKEYPIASFDKSGVPHNINQKYEKIVAALS